MISIQFTDSPVSAAGSPLQYAPLGYRRCQPGPQWCGPLSGSGRNCGRLAPAYRRRFSLTRYKTNPVYRTVPPAGDSWPHYNRHRTILTVSAESYGPHKPVHGSALTFLLLPLHAVLHTLPLVHGPAGRCGRTKGRKSCADTVQSQMAGRYILLSRHQKIRRDTSFGYTPRIQCKWVTTLSTAP